MSINIFGTGGNNLYYIEQDLNLNNNAIHGVKDFENDSDAVNKRYVDDKLLVSHNENGEYIGKLSLNADKEFSIYFGNNKNVISWRNRPTQPIRFTASTGFLFTLDRTLLMTMSARNGIQPHKNIDMGGTNRIINLPTPVNAADCASKAYCDSKVSKSGDTMIGSLYIDGSTKNIDLGCNNLGGDQYFRLYLGSEANKMNSYNNVIDLFAGRIITVNVGSERNVIVVDAGGIVITKPLSMNGNVISGLGNPQEPRDAINKQCFDMKIEELNARLQLLESNFN